MRLTSQSEVGRIRQLLMKSPEEAFAGPEAIEAEWRALRYIEKPNYAKAVAEFTALERLLEGLDIEIAFLPRDVSTGLDSIYVRDASIVCDAGVVLCNMEKPQRRGEPAASLAGFETLRRNVLGSIQGAGRIDGGDVAWLDERTLLVGRGYRTNDEGIAQLRTFLPDDVELIVIPLPHWRGPADVFHLMSILSPIDKDLLLVYSPLMPVASRQWLIEGGFGLVEVPDAEFDSMGGNVLAVAPRQCVMLAGNPITQSRVEEAGATVTTFQGDEISRKGCGGPTCLTRPVVREA